ncbi:hypothetical protein SAMN04488554_0115 [Ruania alba]|uniref:Alpha/beta hydrolase n=1 Tax=Ruania alba TaxID=648782 RepID=A0A1H5BJ24_9MICO|nr:hypothetical protein SAMN04488554_0115 [Ruania alba]
MAAVLSGMLLVACAAPADEPTPEPTVQPTAVRSGSASPSEAEPPPGLEPAAVEESFTCLTELPASQWLVDEEAGIAGALAGSGETLVILSRQVNGDLCSWAFFAEQLTDAGYQVGLPSYRSGDPIALQLGLAATAREQGVEDVLLVGASMGGTYALGAAAVMDPAPAGVVALSPPSEFDPPGPAPVVDAVAAADELAAPLLVLVGAEDAAFVGPAESIGAAAGVDPVVLEADEHGIALVREHDDVRQQVVDFIADPR